MTIFCGVQLTCPIRSLTVQALPKLPGHVVRDVPKMVELFVEPLISGSNSQNQRHSYLGMP